jgi:hypothetical protein
MYLKFILIFGLVFGIVADEIVSLDDGKTGDGVEQKVKRRCKVSFFSLKKEKREKSNRDRSQ